MSFHKTIEEVPGNIGKPPYCFFCSRPIKNDIIRWQGAAAYPSWPGSQHEAIADTIFLHSKCAGEFALLLACDSLHR